MIRNRISNVFVQYSLTWGTALFFAAVCAYFLALPLQSDTTALIAVMTLFAFAAVKAQKLLPCFRERALKWPLAAFGVFVLVALVASFFNPATLRYFPRLLIWLCCVFSGVVFGLAFPRCSGGYLWAILAAIVGSFAGATIFFGFDAPSLWHDGRLKLFAMHPSRLALYAAVAFLFLLHTAVAKKRFECVLAIAGSLFLLFILVKTNTRGNLLMLPFGVIFLGAALPRRYWKRFGIAILFCVILAGGVLFTAKGTFTGNRLISAVTNVTEDSNFKSRLPIWEIGWKSFTKSPVIGHGYHSYLGLHAKFLEEHKAELDARYEYYEPRVKQAHNLVLGRLVETGILGTAAFFLFYFAAAVAAWRGPQENRWLVAPLLFYLGMSMLDDGLFRINDAFMLFLAGNAVASGVLRPVERGD